MNIIENFAAIPVEDQIALATALIKTINSEKIFHDEVQFEIAKVEPYDLTGDLAIELAPVTIEVLRDASWYCSDDPDENDMPADDDDITFAEYPDDDAKKAFKTLSTVIEGYKVTLSVDDADEGQVVGVEATGYEHGDNGIGHYDYFGYEGYDSQPYLEAWGTVEQECECFITLYVEPDDTAAVPEED
jgi:hypothetical protein